MPADDPDKCFKHPVTDDPDIEGHDYITGPTLIGAYITTDRRRITPRVLCLPQLCGPRRQGHPFCRSLEEFFTTYLQGIPTDIDEVDTVYSYVATFFRIMRHLPNRFNTYDPDPDKPEKYIWDWHHKD
ncbi:hypothetical protein FPANT_5216 [Fusarium pseudoanthophilum]|uniref:Uncharacterized protein n=1 Tax=Fusarium pseudoanthophilum TaxID=48495 RepID=A0A8H5PAV5_9HYPO|nr:hypothetical protein FPANT_5216 [Fusarium pseudoanthophilum]